MWGALVIPLLLAQNAQPAEAPPRVVALAVKGATASADYVALQKYFARIPGTARVSFWVAKDDYHFHLYVKEPIRVSAVESALEAARNEMKSTLDMVVRYTLDEDRLPVLAGSAVACEDDPAVRLAIGKVAVLAESRTTAGRLEARLAAREGVLTLGSLRRAVEGTGARLDEVLLAGGSPPPARFVCPNKCSESAGEGFCPSCSNQLVKGSGAVGAVAGSGAEPLPPAKQGHSGGCCGH